MLPNIPNKSQQNIKQDISFYGLNYSDNYSEGEFKDACGMSTARYPFMSQRKGRSLVASYNQAEDIFEWDSHLIVSAGGFIFVDGTPIEQVDSGKKQFTVVGNNLIVFPDKIMINLSDNSYTKLDASISTNPGTNSAVFSATNKTLTANLRPTFTGGSILSTSYNHGSTSGWDGFHIYTYGTDRSAVEACWNNTTKQWNMTALNALRHKKRPWSEVYGTNWANEVLEFGDIIIPSMSGNSFSAVVGLGTDPNGDPDVSQYNNKGYYMVLDSTYNTSNYKWEQSVEYYGYFVYTAYFRGVGGAVYNASIPPKFADIFSVGDRINISGTTNNNLSKAKITAIDANNNVITFGEETIVDETKSTTVTIQRYFHDFDYICESGNRLWGVDNNTNTVWASQLGLPNNFELDETTDLGAYYVEIGSEGDFTALCSYGGSVCAWKENRLVKILGDYPSNFYTNEYEIKGVQKNSEKSLCNINEVLYFKGVDGVYAFTGSTPTRISDKLGRDIYTDSAGGTDGMHYYISMKKGIENYFLSYDLLNGLWMREDNILAKSFCTLDAPYFVADGMVYKMNQEGEIFEWFAEFTPFTEKAKTSSGHRAMFERKHYSKLYFRLDMEEGSNIHISIKEDNEKWKEVFVKSADKESTIQVPLPIGRCDKLRVKVSGKGNVLIEAMAREFNLGSKI